MSHTRDVHPSVHRQPSSSRPPATVRDYADLDARVRAAALDVEVIGSVQGRALYRGRRTEPASTLARILVIAGTHGDEPATVEAALQLLEGTAPVDLEGFDVDILPCTNPMGWERHTRESAEGHDLNWSWHRQGIAEVEVLRAWLQGRRWDSVLDFHEDWETAGFYLYEHRLGVVAAGPRMVRAVADGMAINRQDEIEGWPARDGVVSADSSRERMQRGEGLPLVLLRDHTPHKLTTETPTELPLATRVCAHHAALRALLEHHRERAAGAQGDGG